MSFTQRINDQKVVGSLWLIVSMTAFAMASAYCIVFAEITLNAAVNVLFLGVVLFVLRKITRAVTVLKWNETKPVVYMLVTRGVLLYLAVSLVIGVSGIMFAPVAIILFGIAAFTNYYGEKIIKESSIL